MAFGAAWAALWGSRLEPGRRGGVAADPSLAPLNELWTGRRFAGSSGLERGLFPESLAHFAHGSVAVTK